MDTNLWETGVETRTLTKICQLERSVCHGKLGLRAGKTAVETKTGEGQFWCVFQWNLPSNPIAPAIANNTYQNRSCDGDCSSCAKVIV